MALDFEADRPLLTRENELVVKVWNFCGGWKPEAVPLALLYYDVADPAFVLSQLMVLRECYAAHERAQRDTEG